LHGIDRSRKPLEKLEGLFGWDIDVVEKELNFAPEYFHALDELSQVVLVQFI
jgi:hypothetical protein